MIVLTGATGFIGSCFLRTLNDAGLSDILLVDKLDHPAKKSYLKAKRYRALMSPERFHSAIRQGSIPGKVTALIHLGANSSTLATNAGELMANNTGYSIDACLWALNKRARVIYASSAATYGDGENGYSDDPKRLGKLKPMNLYGWSKQLFDIWVQQRGLDKQLLGLKFFNVFGPNETHKGEMRSLVDKAFFQIVDTGKLKLFKSHRKGIGHGEQTRDFVYVKDVCDVMLDALKRPKLNGIYNLGTGKARNWNSLAAAVFAAMGRKLNIEYVDMPQALRGKYQYHTQADMRRYFMAAKTHRFSTLENSVADYVQQHLVPGRPY